ncbi:GNAT family N-acetyltransferase [Methanoculleus sp. FWC-SCC1]|uniref:GNAT family N-acetyltransferase n=1 Tax=Methanoculleus frigidifontis TaxID=2584085 RepID=A0ABT8M711_9EURY|nr:GNAT family N-acetyltransferase [Methanoculleus sp. FWC-SCC1]MDN7023722.1 GNAT family N-acetyltransferase [Methanoculleus sp. FWC-SCC1]
MEYSLQELSEENAAVWESFNNRSPEGTFFHSLKWKSVLEDALNLDLKYWILYKGREAVGILPSKTRRLPFLKGLDPIPYSECNSILLDTDFNPHDLNAILSLFAQKYRYLFLNVNEASLVDHIGYDHYPADDTGNMILNLRQRPPDSIWESFPAKKGQRKFIRRFDEKSFTIREICREEAIQQFYRYYVENLTRMQGDILPLSFFQRLLETFSPADMRITSLAKGDLYAGGLLTFLHPAGRTAYFQYLSLNRNLPGTFHPTYPLFWEGLVWAWNNGYDTIFLGRQKLDPTNTRFRIKADFGADHVPIYSRVVLLSKMAALPYRMKNALAGGDGIPV